MMTLKNYCRTLNESIVDYYENCEFQYKRYWDLNRSLSFHYGYWDKDTKNLPQALTNINQAMSDKIQIKSSDYILDAGCGIGGSSIYLAKKFGCHVLGITLSKKQMQAATQNAIKHNVDHLVKFEKKDFTETVFDENIFDIVWAIESICHASDKVKFLREAYRILKKTGSLILADFFKTNKEKCDKDLKILDTWTQGWFIPSLETDENFLSSLQKTGFIDINVSNITENILPSSKRLFYLSYFGFIGEYLKGITGNSNKFTKGNVLAANFQYKALKRNLWSYMLIKARNEG